MSNPIEQARIVNEVDSHLIKACDLMAGMRYSHDGSPETMAIVELNNRLVKAVLAAVDLRNTVNASMRKIDGSNSIRVKQY